MAPAVKTNGCERLQGYLPARATIVFQSGSMWFIATTTIVWIMSILISFNWYSLYISLLNDGGKEQKSAKQKLCVLASLAIEWFIDWPSSAWFDDCRQPNSVQPSSASCLLLLHYSTLTGPVSLLGLFDLAEITPPDWVRAVNNEHTACARADHGEVSGRGIVGQATKQPTSRPSIHPSIASTIHSFIHLALAHHPSIRNIHSRNKTLSILSWPLQAFSLFRLLLRRSFFTSHRDSLWMKLFTLLLAFTLRITRYFALFSWFLFFVGRISYFFFVRSFSLFWPFSVCECVRVLQCSRKPVVDHRCELWACLGASRQGKRAWT